MRFCKKTSNSVYYILFKIDVGSSNQQGFQAASNAKNGGKSSNSSNNQFLITQYVR